MLELDKSISVFVRDHLPSFYKEEGQDFVAFIEAYFEYLESVNKPIYDGRRLLEYRDIDLTLDEFVQDFVDKYLSGIPDTTVLQPSDEETRKRFLIKHIFDLYRSKGTERGYRLLFRLLFDEDIEVQIPGDVIIRPSDATYLQTAFIEVTDKGDLTNVIGSRIEGSTSGATALVEGVRKVYVNLREVVIVDISDVTNRFITGEYVFDKDRQYFTDATNAPIVVGSLSSLDVVSGGANYSIGDVVRIDSNEQGFGGTAVVSETKDLIGAVIPTINDGGSGYKLAQTVIDTNDETQYYDASEITIQKVGPITEFTVDDGGTDYPEVPRWANGQLATITTQQLAQGIYWMYYSSSPGDYDFYNRLLTGATGPFGYWPGLNGLAHIDDVPQSSSSFSFLDRIFNFMSSSTAATTSSSDYSTMAYTIGSPSYNRATLNSSTAIGQYNYIRPRLQYYENFREFWNFITRRFIITDVVANLQPWGVHTDFQRIDTSVPNVLLSPGYPGLFFTSGTNTATGEIESIYIANTGAGLPGNTVINVGPSDDVWTWAQFGNTDYAVQNSTHFYGNTTLTQGNNASLSFTIPGSGFDFEIGTLSDTEEFTINTDFIGGNNEFGNTYLSTTLDDQYGFPAEPTANLSTLLGDALTYANLTIGTIQTLGNLATGSGYEEAPLVKVTDQDIAPLDLSDGEGGFIGDNADITTSASQAQDSAVRLNVITSGVGYRENDQVTLVSDTNESVIVANVGLGFQGARPGQWAGTQGIIDTVNRIQDSYFYQEYSYNIKSRRALDKYKEIAKRVIHPAGVALFGTLETNDSRDETTEVVVSSLTQANT